MEYSVLFFLAWLLSLGMGLLVAAVAVTYVRRTWQLIRADEGDSTHHRILDGLDELNVRLHGINERLIELDERLQRMEKRLPEGAVIAKIAGPVAESRQADR